MHPDQTNRLARPRRRVAFSALMALLLAFSFLVPLAQANEAANGSANVARDIAAPGYKLMLPVVYRSYDGSTPGGVQARVRVGVVEDGITVIAPSDLSAAGVNPAGVDPRTFALSSLGQPVAIYVTGEGDGKFDGADRVYFFGEKFRGPEMDQKYTDERVYWLDMGATPGPRMAAIDAMPLYDRTPPADFPTTLRAEQNLEWWTLHTITLDTEDTWFWSRLQIVTGTTAKSDHQYNVPYPANAPATFRLEEISRTHSWSSNPDHRTIVTLNGAPVLDETWDGLRVRKVFSAPLPAGVLAPGVNTVSVTASTLPGTVTDDIYVNYWELDYRRLFRAWEDQIDFRAETGGVQEYAVSDWTGADVLAWDVTDPLRPVRLNVPQAAGGSLQFRVDTAAGNRYWLQGANTLQAPASVRLRPPTGLRTPPGGADAVIVTSTALRPQAERLAEWHRAHGRRTIVADFNDVRDEFNEGIYHPRAVRNMMTWAATNWQGPAPQYLTLFGDGHSNVKGYNTAKYLPADSVHIPPYLAFEDDNQGEVPVDSLYGELTGDRLPDIAIGRIPVNTLAEAQVVVDKILTYDESTRAADWQRKAIFVADNPDGAGDFDDVSEEIISGYTPADLQVERVYLPLGATAEQISATRAALLSAWQAGAFMVQYTGHGSIQRWTHELILTTDHILAEPSLFTNGPRLPIVMTFNCLDGYFAHAQPSWEGIAETMLRRSGGGSIAAISPTGLGYTADQLEFRKVLLTVMFQENVREPGRALTIAKQRYAQTHGADYLTQTMTLFGDPALRLPAPQ